MFAQGTRYQKVFHSTIEHPKADDRLQLLGDDAVRRVRPNVRGGHRQQGWIVKQTGIHFVPAGLPLSSRRLPFLPKNMMPSSGTRCRTVRETRRGIAQVKVSAAQQIEISCWAIAKMLFNRCL
jgi:hypothetical protein